MRRHKPWIMSLTLAAGVAGMLSCAPPSGEDEGAPQDQTLPDYLDDVWGIRIDGFDETEEILEGDDGTILITGVGTITVDGLGSSELSTETIISPQELGGDVTFFVSNLDGSEQRYFLYDVDENYITIGDLVKGVAVSGNPDGTYEVWAFDGDTQDMFVTVEDGYQALQMVEQYNGFTDISPYIMLMAFAVAHTPAVIEARTPSSCTNTASEPTVCDIFKEFCDCAACLVLDRQGACEPCPEL